ncbi:Transcription factor iws1, partial [Thoreauomyces humboldtii]
MASEQYKDIFGGSDSELDEVQDIIDRMDEDDNVSQGSDAEPNDASDLDFSISDLPKFKKKETQQVDLPEGFDQPRPAKKKKILKRRGDDTGSTTPSRRKKAAATSGSDDEVHRHGGDSSTGRALSPASRLRQEAHNDVDEAMRKGKRKKAVQMEVGKMEDIMASILGRMRETAEEDKEANTKRRPAVAKLKALPEVMAYLQREQLLDQFLDNHILEGIRAWLEPLPDASLPSLDIQITMFDVLKKMQLNKDHLQDSKIGRIVTFYTKCSRVTNEIQKVATHLVDKWMRPILKRSADYKDYSVAAIPKPDDRYALGGALPPRRSVTISSGGAEDPESNSTRARIPQRIAPAFTVVPQSSVSQQQDMEGPQK